MSTSPAAAALKALRVRSGLSVADVAARLGVPKSTYASKEDKFKKDAFPPDFVRVIAPIFEAEGIPEEETWRELTGIVPSETSHLPAVNSAELTETLALRLVSAVEKRFGIKIDDDVRSGLSTDFRKELAKRS